MIHIAIIEDDEDIRISLRDLINQTHDLCCHHLFSSAEQAISEWKTDMVDVVLMDINLPDQSGIECAAILKQRIPNLQIIMLTVYDDTDKIFRSLKAGASGYLLKRTEPSQILTSIRDVYAGGSPMTSQIARKVVSFFSQSETQPDSGNELHSLTAREFDILRYLAKGYRYQEIADVLFISIETVRTHLRRVYEKLHVRSRTEAVIKYLGKNS